MYYSRYNILLPMPANAEFPYALMNPLAGAFDLVGPDDYLKISQLQPGRELPDPEPLGPELLRYLTDRGYLYASPAEEDERLQERVPEFERALHATAPQVLLVPTYACNLACPYCYQNGIKHKNDLITKEVADAFFAHLARQFPGRKPFITLFGGEPLNWSPRQKEIIDYIVKRAAGGGYAIAAVTNGYGLAEYLDILQQAVVREIQVTLDGPRAVHNRRRPTVGGQGTYDKIMNAVAATIERGIPVNLRAVVDKSNFASLVDLAEDLDRRGWLDLPPQRFKTQIGRNYELFECYAKPQHLLDQAEHWAMFVQLAAKHPLLPKFHQPEFKGINHLVQSGELYLPSYDTCPACKTEWVFDLYGDIYSCTATTGQDAYKLGTFYPEYRLHEQEVREWQERSVLTIPQCRDCAVSLICGGGCGAVAKEKHGKIQAPDCRPIKEILTLGLEYYGDKILSMGY